MSPRGNLSASSLTAGQLRQAWEDERDIIAFLVNNEDDLPRVLASLEEQDFSDSQARDGYLAVLELLRRGDPVNIVTWSAHLRSTDSENKADNIIQVCLGQGTGELYSVPTVLAAAKRMREVRLRRSLEMTLNGAVYKLREGKTSYTDTVDEILSALAGQYSDRIDLGLYKLSDVAADVAVRLDQPARPRITSPWGNVNAYWEDLSRGNLVVIGARPKIGKTALLLQLLCHIADTAGPVLLITLEMTPAELVERILSRHLKVPISALTGARIRAILGDLAKRGVYFARGRHTIDSIETVIRMFKLRHPGAAAVAVDFLQLIARGKEDSRDIRERVDDQVRRFKAMLDEAEVVGFLLSQLRRIDDNERPRPHHLLESGGIEAAGNKICLLYRDPDFPGRICLDTALARNGPSGVALLDWSPRTYLFTDWAATAPGTRRRVAPVAQAAGTAGPTFEEVDF